MSNQSLTKIVKGGGIAFIGSLMSLGFAFAARLLVARVGTESDYGIFALLSVLVSVFVILAVIGLPQGTPRSIAFERARQNHAKVQQLARASIFFGIVSSIFISIFVFFMADVVASNIFNEPRLAYPLRIVSFGIPFLSLTQILVSIFQGFDDIRPRILFQDILRNVSFVIALLPVVFLGLGFTSVYFAFLCSLLLPGVLTFIYTGKHSSVPIWGIGEGNRAGTGKELLFFSLPLFMVAAIQLIVTWTDIIMLGALKTFDLVGIYNAAQLPAQFLGAPLTSIVMIYLPIASGLYSLGQKEQLRKDFATIVKWLTAVTMPPFLLCFIFPEAILTSLFGEAYAPGANALRILSLTFFSMSLMGPNYSTLVAIGKPKFMLWTSIATALLNITLNLVLIPYWGIEGAAIASAGAVIPINMLRVWILNKISGVTPLSMHLVKSIAMFLPIALAISYLLHNTMEAIEWMWVPLLISFYVIYGLGIVLTKSLSQDDVMILLEIERKTGLNLAVVKRLLRKIMM